MENVVRALQNVSLYFLSQTNKEAVLEIAGNFQLMLWDCHHRCEFPSRTRCSQVAVLSLSSPNRVDTRQVGRLKSDIKAGFHLKAVFTSLNVAFVPISRSRFKQRQIPPLRTFTNVLRFCVNFWMIFGHSVNVIFFLKG